MRINTEKSLREFRDLVARIHPKDQILAMEFSNWLNNNLRIVRVEHTLSREAIDQAQSIIDLEQESERVMGMKLAEVLAQHAEITDTGTWLSKTRVMTITILGATE